MNKIGFALLICTFFLLGSKSDEPEKGLVPDKKMLHIGIVVKDIEASRENWTKFLGLDKKPDVVMAEGHEDNPTQYRGDLTSAKAKLSFFQLENLQVELIEPTGEEPSHWREFLETKGEGVHHIAFSVKGLGEQYMEEFERNHLPLLQHGGWDGGEYGYMDGTSSLGVVVELLEFYRE